MGIFNKRKKEEQKENDKIQGLSAVAKKQEKKSAVEKGVKGKVKKNVVEKKKSTLLLNGQPVLVRPLITEKATLSGTYVFEVHPDVNKSEISKAVEHVYGVKPKHVRVMNVLGKQMSLSRRQGKRKDWKKAIVRLPEGKTINVYEGI